jgi:hypothetical protein
MKKLYTILLALSCFASAASAQSNSTAAQPTDDTVATRRIGLKPRFVVLDDYIRDFLAKEWDKHLNDPIKLERAFCLRWQYDVWAGEPAYRVTQISNADSADATPNSISFVCPTGNDVAEIHIHPNQTCIEDRLDILQCWDGGPYSHQCLPSDADRAYVTYVHQEFGMVQCSRDATVFYFAAGDNR